MVVDNTFGPTGCPGGIIQCNCLPFISRLLPLIFGIPLLEKFLAQRVDQRVDMPTCYAGLAEVLGAEWQAEGDEGTATAQAGEPDERGDYT